MKISQIFLSEVTRDIPPVIYFHEQKPEKLAAEVGEYIITGGYEEGDPRKKRIGDGIHEQYVHLLRALADEMARTGGAELPACWISGFYGSGKSSFAKLLGLALDNRVLPDGKALAEALLARDDSPLSQEFRDAWHALRGPIDPMAVVFDIGAVGRDEEHIHSAVKRQLQERLGYSTSSSVADYELKLEQDGKYSEFLARAEEALGKPWAALAGASLAEEHFSEVMHRLNPARYEDPLAWLDVRAGERTGAGTSVEETVKDIEAMLGFRAPGKTLFLVVDEVSQYIHGHEGRMLKLQSFVAALGQRLKGRVWLVATGQQKLEEDLDGGNLSKLKDRFPPRLRVHLAPTNIRDVVHKRLLKKDPDKEKALEELFERHRPDLRLYGYKCESLTSTDFLEVYPMLPGHVDLLMQITSNLRARSSRMKGDDHAIRGLLQLLGELFRELKLGDKPVGTLLTLDQIYDVQHTALDSDVQNTMTRLGNQTELACDPLIMKAAKAVALLELVQDQEATTAELVARCLYPELGAGSQVDALGKALEKLCDQGFLSRSEKQGYKIQSSAGQEWTRERESYHATNQARSELVREKLRELLGQITRPRYKNRGFPVTATFSDGQHAREERLAPSADPANVGFDFYYLTGKEDRKDEHWLKESGQDLRKNRVLWVNGPTSHLEQLARELIQSRQMVKHYEPRQESLAEGKRRLLFEERNRLDHWEQEMAKQVAECYLEGELYFRARKLPRERYARNFPGILQGAGEEVLPALYPHYVDLAVTEKELNQLLSYDLQGVSNKFMGDGLGLLELDSGRYVPTCKGEVPVRIRTFIEQQNGVSGQALQAEFGGPPCGYPSDIVRACVLGLMRAGQVFLRPPSGLKTTSVKDPDVQDIFGKDKDFKATDVLPAGEPPVTARMKIAIRQFLEASLGLQLAESDNDHLADAIFKHFPLQSTRLQELHRKLARLPRQPELPRALEGLSAALAKSLGSRLVEQALVTVHGQLEKLRDGLQSLGILLHDLTDPVIEQVRLVDRVRTVELDQLKQVGLGQEVAAAWDLIERQLESDRPWTDIGPAVEQAGRIQARYREVRAESIEKLDALFKELAERVKLREGFAELKPEQAESVLRPLRDAYCATTAEAAHPALAFLRDSVPNRMREAVEDCNRRLDEIIDDVTVIQVRLKVAGREFSSAQEVEAWLEEMRVRVMAQLKEGVRVRLV